jgi:electron transfer flavoprotein beta subunit
VKIVVGVKHVPDTESKIRIAADGRSIDETGLKWIVSPYDEFALEEALRIREASGSGEVIAVSAGREAAAASLRQALAMGADRAVLVADPRLDRADALLRAQALAAVVRAEQAGLVLLGKYGVGTDEWLTGPMLAELLDWPHAAAVSKLRLGSGAFTAEREVEGALEVQEGQLPAVLTCEKGLNEPRYPSLKGIMQAKKKPLETRSAAELGLDAAALDAPSLVWEALELPPARAGAVMLDGTPQEAADELARLLREVAKVI